MKENNRTLDLNLGWAPHLEVLPCLQCVGYSELSPVTLTARLGDYHRGFSSEVNGWDCVLSVLENADRARCPGH